MTPTCLRIPADGPTACSGIDMGPTVRSAVEWAEVTCPDCFRLLYDSQGPVALRFRDLWMRLGNALAEWIATSEMPEPVMQELISRIEDTALMFSREAAGGGDVAGN